MVAFTMAITQNTNHLFPYPTLPSLKQITQTHIPYLDSESLDLIEIPRLKIP